MLRAHSVLWAALGAFGILGVGGILVRLPEPESIFVEPESIREVHLNTIPGTTMESQRTRWVFGKGDRSYIVRNEPKRSLVSRLFKHHRLRNPSGKMKNLLSNVGLKPHHHNRLGVPPPMKIRCCVRFKPGYQPKYRNIRILTSHPSQAHRNKDPSSTYNIQIPEKKPGGGWSPLHNLEHLDKTNAIPPNAFDRGHSHGTPRKKDKNSSPPVAINVVVKV